MSVPEASKVSTPPAAGKAAKSKLPGDRWRLRATISVHPSTLVALDALCEKFRTNRGRLIDKLVETVSASYKDGRVRCVTGGACTINRTDLPEVL